MNTENRKTISERIDAVIVGEGLDDLIPVFTSYIANCGAHAMVPRDVLKDYVGKVIEDTYNFFALPSNKDHIQ